MRTRRQFLATASAAMVGYGLSGSFANASAREELSRRLQRALPQIEKASGGRLGVAVLDTATGATFAHRGDERFPMCSTSKLLTVGAVLTNVDAGKDHLDRRILYTAKDLVTYSPATKHHNGAGMTLAELCAAAITLSDNTAANLLLSTLGGPAGFTRFARTLGDKVTRLDRTEPTLNEAMPGDPRDTTTPTAMLGNLHTLVLGHALSAGSREHLTQWLLANTTSGEKLRAGVPTGWRVADKTGSGGYGSNNDVGVLWPPQHAPVLVTIYLTDTKATTQQGNATVADVARAVVAALA
ncbi:MAG: class A beta-lactamase [Acidobacteriaceae bacterium]